MVLTKLHRFSRTHGDGLIPKCPQLIYDVEDQFNLLNAPTIEVPEFYLQACTEVAGGPPK